MCTTAPDQDDGDFAKRSGAKEEDDVPPAPRSETLPYGAKVAAKEHFLFQ
jgi:hypothetical protein